MTALVKPSSTAAGRGDSGGKPVCFEPSILGDPVRYRRWREWKLETGARYAALPPVEIGDPAHLGEGELSALRERVAAVNFAVYRTGGNPAFTHDALKRLCRQAGLVRPDANPFADASGISEIRVAEGARGAYIPYTNRALNWHTDGYYNPPQRRIGAFAMHTIYAAADGGENQFLDHEMLYLLLRDREPALAACLFARDVLGIPPDRSASSGPQANAMPRESEGARWGPVFSLTGAGRLHLRFTLRKRHAHWKPSRTVRAALAEIQSILADPHNPHILTRRFAPGEGVIANNVPHNRTAFGNPAGQPGRLVLRARFYDGIDLPGAT